MFGALAMMLPDKVKAAGDGGNTGISIGGYSAERKPFVYVDFDLRRLGARPWADGLDGNSHMFANMASHSIEVTEASIPFRSSPTSSCRTRRRVRIRGGVPFKRDYRFLEEEGMLQVRSDRRDHRPFGLYGGSPGGPSENYLTPTPRIRKLLPSKLTMTIKRGDVFRHVLAGAGGWGDPLERDFASVLRDVRNELLSPEKALADYGVVIDLDWRVHEAATARRRCEIAKARGWATVPKVQRHERRLSHLRRNSPCRSPIGSVSTSEDPDYIVLLGSDGAIHTKKVSSSVQNYAQVIVEGLAEVCRESGMTGADIVEIPTRHHGRFQRHPGAQGRAGGADHHQGVSGRTRRSARYGCRNLDDLSWTKPAPLVERYLRQVVDERIDHRGWIQRALDPADAERAVDALLAEKVEAIAVCLINSFANPVHEAMLKEIIAAKSLRLPRASRSRSCPK